MNKPKKKEFLKEFGKNLKNIGKTALDVAGKIENVDKDIEKQIANIENKCLLKEEKKSEEKDLKNTSIKPEKMTLTRAKLIILSNLETKYTKQAILKALKESYCFINLNCEDVN